MPFWVDLGILLAAECRNMNLDAENCKKMHKPAAKGPTLSQPPFVTQLWGG